MRSTKLPSSTFIGILAAVAGLLVWPGAASAQLGGLGGLLGGGGGGTPAPAVAGQAAAVQATVFGLLGNTNLALANTGTLNGPTDARDASQSSGNLLGALTADVPQASTIGYPDQVDSAASLANLALSIAGSSIGADFVSAQAQAVSGGASSASSSLTNLSLNGVQIPVSGDPNQSIAIPGGTMIVNEQTSTLGGIVVNALHVIVGGVADVAIGTATAAVQ
ncbi:MAG TPA: choice-of-anchor P family protein [Burkholderiales bacterium]|nr:choice-of-anchor P family protein [Burkholderiales bacterium]